MGDRDDRALVRRLEMWATRYLIIVARMRELTSSLAEEGVIVGSLPPRIDNFDSMSVVRGKEELVALHAEGEVMLRGIKGMGGVVIDTGTMEILLPGGPGRESFRSWQPGEPDICHWRENADANGERRRINVAGEDDTKPVTH